MKRGDKRSKEWRILKKKVDGFLLRALHLRYDIKNPRYWKISRENRILLDIIGMESGQGMVGLTENCEIRFCGLPVKVLKSEKDVSLV